VNNPNSGHEPRWLNWAQRLQAISQIGLTYAKDAYDRERYSAIGELAAEIVAAGTDVPFEVVSGIFAQQAGYATPKVDMRGVVFREHCVLLVREKEDGRWTLPGGWADISESPREAVVREVREESGYETRPVKLLAVYDRSKHGHMPPFAFHVYKLFFHCEIVGGAPAASHETTAVEFFAEDALPDLSLSRVTPQQIHRLFEHLHDPRLATDFD
jgi:ADP-ribose pyrophosphatase YjhB (NUDIX family)